MGTIKNIGSIAILSLFTLLFYQNCGSSSNLSQYRNPQSSTSSSNDNPAPTNPITNDCMTNDGRTVKENATIVGFDFNILNCGEKCTQLTFTCNAGVLTATNGSTRYSAKCMQKACSGSSTNGQTIQNLKPNLPHYVSVYGITNNRGTGTDNLTSIRVTDCSNRELARTQSSRINWPDGNAPQQAGLNIISPASGCIKGWTDNGAALSMTAIETYEKGINSNNNTANIDLNKNYFINVYGITTSRGTGTTDLYPVQIKDCNQNTLMQSQTAPTVINWHDGNAPHSASFTISSSQKNCIDGYTDIGNALNISAFPTKNAVAFTNGNKIQNLTVGKKYLVGVYGITSNKENTVPILNGIRIEDCNGNKLGGTPDIPITWPDGHAPQSAELVVTISNSGCIEGFTDGGNAHSLSVVEL